VSVLNAVKEADIKGAIEGLNEDQSDLLVKYIYRCAAPSSLFAPLSHVQLLGAWQTRRTAWVC
jgi:hypothetical protein